VSETSAGVFYRPTGTITTTTTGWLEEVRGCERDSRREQQDKCKQSTKSCKKENNEAKDISEIINSITPP